MKKLNISCLTFAMAVLLFDPGSIARLYGATSSGDLNGDGAVDAADASAMFAAWTGDPDAPGTNAATAEYNPESGELKISSNGAVNVFVQSASSHIIPVNPAPTIPVGLLTNNTSRIGITNLGPINVTNFSFGSIGTGLAMSDLKLVFSPALGQKATEIAAGSVGFRYVQVPEPATATLLGLVVSGYGSLRRKWKRT